MSEWHHSTSLCSSEFSGSFESELTTVPELARSRGLKRRENDICEMKHTKRRKYNVETSMQGPCTYPAVIIGSSRYLYATPRVGFSKWWKTAEVTPLRLWAAHLWHTT